jgi:hypothetical protein
LCPSINQIHKLTTIFLQAIGALGKLTGEEDKGRKAISAAARRYVARKLDVNAQQNPFPRLNTYTFSLRCACSCSPGSSVYVIAHVDKDLKTQQHERWHAIYHFNQAYAKRVAGIWDSVVRSNPKWAKQFEAHLFDKYAKHAWVDEFQAIVLNREYECATKTVNLLQSVVPKKEPFRLVQLSVK